MPCFGTTKRTRSNAEILCEALGVTFGEINITETVKSHFADIGQPADNYDVTFENCQARVRTLELMDYRQQERRLCHRHRRFERAGAGLGRPTTATT